ncbi:MAG TPA: aldo/keto reductase, partial [Solirubrobacteraceae bacterium]|nr:aldo/keto reductase [Solirubrobacteraceae bacterium]
MTEYGGILRDAYPLCLGGNIFGWTIGEEESFAVLDAYAAAGGNLLDTADVYSVWADGNSGGESEAILGSWMASRGNRDEMIVATKVGNLTGVSAEEIREGAEASLRRLQTDRIDLYYTHKDGESVPLEQTLGALDSLVRDGKVRELGASGYGAARLAEALAVSDREGLSRYEVIQPQYNLLERDAYEGELQDLCEREGIACLPFFSLARGFLTGKYRPGQEADTLRGGFAWSGEWDARTLGLLETLDAVAAEHGTTDAAVALAWLRAQPTVAAPIASATAASVVPCSA